MADNEHRVLKSNTFEDQRQKVNEVSFDVGDNALLDNTRLSDKVFTYTASAGQIQFIGNDNNSDSLVIQKLPDVTIDNTAGYIVLEHGTTIPASYVNGATITQSSTYSATIESVVILDSKPRILVKNSTGTFSTSTNLTVGSDNIAHAKILRIISEAFPKGSARVTKNGSELVQGLTEAGYHIPNHRGTIALTSSPTVDDVTEGVTIYQTSDGSNKSTQADVESGATWWATVYHANTSSIKTKNNNGTFSTSRAIRVLGYNSSSIASANVGPLSLLDTSVLHSVELNNEAANGNTINVITTDLVSAINELQDDIGTVENLATSTQADVVSAINEIEGVFDASTKEISAGSNAFNVTSGAFTIDSSGDIILDAGDADVLLKDDGTTYGSLNNSGNNLVIKSGTTTMLTGNGANATFSGTVTAVGTSVFANLDISGNVDIDGTLETDALSINSTAVTSTAAELNILDGATLDVNELNILDGATLSTAELNLLDGVTSTTDELNILDGVTASAADINLVDGIINGTVIANKAIITDSNKDIAEGRNITISGELDAATLDISGNADIDGILDVGNNILHAGNYTLNAASKNFKIQNGSAADKFTVASSSGNTFVGGNLTLGSALTTSGTVLTATDLDVATAINQIAVALGTNIYTGNTGDLIDGSASVTVALKLIETEIGDPSSYGNESSLTNKAQTIAGVLVNLDNETDAIRAISINTASGSGLTGGGNLSANRNLAINLQSGATGGLQIASNALKIKAGGVTNDMLDGSIANGKLANSSITINGTSVSLGGTRTLVTDDIAEDGSPTNLYFTNARWDTRLGQKTTDNLTEGSSNKYFTDERVDDRVADFLIAGDGLTKTEDDDDSGNDSLTLDVDSSVVRTSTNQTISGTKTFTGTIDLSGGSLILGGGAGTDETFNTAFLTLASTSAVEGLKIDRSAISSASVSTSVDATLQWNEAKVGTGASNTSHRAWEVKGLSNAATPVATTADLVTFYNAKDLIGSSSDGLTHTWDDDETTGQHFELGISDGGIAITKLANIATNRVLGRSASGTGAVSAVQVSAGMIASNAITNPKILDSTIENAKLANSSIAVNGTAISLGGSLTIQGTTDEVTVGTSGSTITVGLPDDVVIAGNLTVNGTTTTVNTATLDIEDPLIKLAKNNGSGDAVDIGLYGLYDTSGTDKYAGIFRDATDKKFHLFKDLQAEPSTTVNKAGTGYAVATLVANVEGNITGSSGSCTGNAATATTAGHLTSTKTFALSGDITGTVNDNLADGVIIPTQIGANKVGITELNVTDGSAGQVLRTDGNNNLSFITLPTGDTYDISVVDSSGIKLRLSGSAGTTDDVKFTGTNGATITRTDASTINIDAPSAYTLPNASATVPGGIELFSNVVQTVAGESVSATANRTYGLQVNSAQQGVINVPWTDTVYTLPQATATVRGGVELFSNTVQTVAGNSVSSTAGRTYGVQLNSDNQMVVNVPWVDTQRAAPNNGLLDINPGALIDLTIVGGDFTADKASETDITINVDLTELTLETADIAGSDHLVYIDNGTQKKIAFSNVNLSAFDNTASGFVTSSGVTSVTGVSPIASGGGTTPAISINLDNLPDMTQAWDNTADEFIVLDNGTQKKKLSTEIFGSNAFTNTTIPAAANTGTLTLDTATGLDGGVKTFGADQSGDETFTVSLDFNELPDMTADVGATDQFILLDGSDEKRKAADEIKLSVFNNDANFNNYVHPSYTPRSEDETFVGAQVPDNIEISSDSIGSITALNVTKRNLTLANLGYTGDTNAEVNQNAFSKVQVANSGVNGTLHEADSKTDTITINAGTNLSIVDGVADYFTINNDITAAYNRVRISNSAGTTIATDTASGITDVIHFRAKAGVTLTDEGSGIFGIAVNSDQRGNVAQFGPNTNDYIVVDSNSADFFLDGVRDMSLENDGELHVRGDVIAFSTTITSDQKLKENIKTVDNPIEKVMALSGVTFNWKENGKASAGVIAQDVEEVLPSAVKEVDNMDKTDTHKVVDYNQLSALFIESIKELKHENELLKAEIESLKDINKGIE